MLDLVKVRDRVNADAYEDFDAFGDDDKENEEKTEEQESREEKMNIMKEAEERLAMKGAKQRTLVSIEIKPWDVDQDLISLWKKVTTTVVQDGLKWGEKCILVPVAFGIKKIQCSFTMGVNNSSDTILEEIESLEDEVQSVEITSMNVL